jgi:hypothetical protein
MYSKIVSLEIIQHSLAKKVNTRALVFTPIRLEKSDE